MVQIALYNGDNARKWRGYVDSIVQTASDEWLITVLTIHEHIIVSRRILVVRPVWRNFAFSSQRTEKEQEEGEDEGTGKEEIVVLEENITDGGRDEKVKRERK